MQEKKPQKQSFIQSQYLKVFSEISAWIVGPVIVALIIGKYLDTKYQTTPWILVFLLGASFTASMIVIVQIAKRYLKEETKENNNESK
jgi:F0F1-type ATP synthase assembly protein I